MPSARNARYALAGLQAGIAGALGLLLWMALASRFFGKSVWWPSNLLATVFYGDAALRFSFGRYTLAGAALILFLYGAIGILFGLAWRDRAGGVALFGACLALAVLTYYVLLKGAFHRLSPAAALYAPDRLLFAGHLLFGACLTRFSRFRDKLADLPTVEGTIA